MVCRLAVTEWDSTYMGHSVLMVASKNGVKPFRLTTTQARLLFDNTEFAGMEVMTRLNVPLGVFLDLQSLASQDGGTDAGALKQAFELFASDVLISWNIEDEYGNALPANGVGMLEITPQIATAILKAWTESVGQLSKA